MAFEATKREWSELYVFFRLLADGKVSLGTPQAKKEDEKYRPIAMIQREEHDGTRRYYIEEEVIRMEGEKVEKSIPREDFATVADLILDAIKNSSADEVTSPDGVEEFLDEAGIFDLEARTEDRTDFSIAFWHPTVNKINALPESPTEVAERMMMIERLGGVLKYSDVADRVFRCNLLMIDLHFPRVLAEMVRMMHLDGITRVSELTEQMKIINPLKIKEELISKHGFYEFKMKQFLLALALGMRPAKIYNGTDSAVEGILLVDGKGEVLCYHKSEKKTFEDFLYLNSRLEKGSVDKDKYGFLERENGVYYFKLNVKIGLIKR